MSKNSVAAVIVAAGRSKRMGRLGDKIWIKIAGRPILFYSLRAFLRAGMKTMVVVVRPEDVRLAASRISRWFRSPRADIRVVAGGCERQDSVWNGITAAGAEYVLVHDAARPAVRPDLIRTIFLAARADGAAVPVVPVIDTLKCVSGSKIVRTETREGLYGVQTPQGFRRDVLCKSISAARRKNFVATDCSALVESLGKKVTAVPGDPTNLKLTTPEDVWIFRKLLTSPTR